MDDTRRVPDELLADYLAGEISAGDKRRVEHWLAQDPGHAETLNKMQSLWESVARRAREPLDVESAVQAIEAYTKQTYVPSSKVQPLKSFARTVASRNSIARWTSLAVAIAVLVTGMAFWPALQSSITGITGDTAKVYATARAERSTITLPDGSRVVLAPDTRLRYSQEAGARVVGLEGQAYFTVTPNDKRPFVVRSGTLVTQVLGTAFVIRAYPTDQMARVAVAEGRVAVGVETTAETEMPLDVPNTVLVAGDVGTLPIGAESRDQVLVSRDVTIAEVVGWMHGEVVFNAAPFREVAYELERTYDIEIVFEDQRLAERPVTAAFHGKSAKAMVSLLAMATGAEYRWEGKRVVFVDRSSAQ